MKALHVAAAVALAIAVTLTGMYAVAATAATTLAASITTEETDRHSRSIEFAAGNDRAAARYRTPAPEPTSTTKRSQKP